MYVYTYQIQISVNKCNKINIHHVVLSEIVDIVNVDIHERLAL